MNKQGPISGWGAVVSPELVYERIRHAGDVLLIDVRTPGDFMSLLFHASYNVPLGTLHEHREAPRRHVGSPLVLVCRSVQRARRAETAVREIGMASLHVLDGGGVAWEAAARPLVR